MTDVQYDEDGDMIFESNIYSFLLSLFKEERSKSSNAMIMSSSILLVHMLHSDGVGSIQ